MKALEMYGILVQKTESASFRLEKEILEQLRNEAEKKQISLNVLVNQVLRQYRKFSTDAPPAGFVAIPKHTLSRIMDKLTEKEVEEVINAHVENDMEDIILLFRNEFTPESFLDVVESWVLTQKFPFKHEIKDGVHKCLIQHDMGRNWSLYLSEIFSRTLEKLTSKKVERNITDNTIVFTADLSKGIIEK